MIVRKSQLQLVPADSPLLHRVPEPYDFDEHKDTTDMFANLMFERMKELKGMGLSANQVGINTQFFTMGLDELRIDVFNPKIISTSGETTSEEGCLSFPGIFLQIKRPLNVEVEYQNSLGETVRTRLTGLTARVFLHEYDHMMGKTFKSKVSSLKWALAEKKLKNVRDKLKKQIRQRYIADTYKEMSNVKSQSTGV